MGKLSADTIYVIYDHDCPFCRTYCTKIRIQESAGSVELVDARKSSSLMDEITELGLDIDQGMVVKMGAQIYYGADAIHILALMSSQVGWFNRINYQIFKSETLSKCLYPVLRTFRNLALWILGIPFIRNLERAQ